MLSLARVSGLSMAPTLRPADVLLTVRAGRAAPLRGDVVVVRRSGGLVVKRVVALAGDIVELEAGRLFVDGRSVDGRPRVRGALTQRWQVPPGQVFLAGDNAAASDDSRVWPDPFVPLADVEARVVARLPPLRLPRLPRLAPARGVSPRRRDVAARPAA